MFSQEKADAVCRRVSSGESVRKAVIAEGTTLPSFLRWCSERADLADQYARAMSVRADVIFEELDDACEDAVATESAVRVAGLRLKVDTIKWKLAKMQPKKYGEKVDLTHSGGDKPVVFNWQS